MAHQQFLPLYEHQPYHDFGYEHRVPHPHPYHYNNQMIPVFGGSDEAPNYLPDTGKMFEPIKIQDYEPPKKV